MKTILNLFICCFLLVGSINGQISDQFFVETHDFLQKVVKDNNVDYSLVKNNPMLPKLVNKIAKADLSSASKVTKEAFYINAYNLLVMDGISKFYPISSTKDIPGFFDQKQHLVGGKELTLNDFEKEYLLKPYNDLRHHFVLVCAAASCPPITDAAYLPEKLDQQLNVQTRKALNDPMFIKVVGNNIALSQIFNWYKSDFGNKQAIFDFINTYRTKKIPANGKISYYDYNWDLNDSKNNKPRVVTPSSVTSGGNNASRYIVSSTIPKGSIETKIFNNLYTQRTGSVDDLTSRSTFFTTTVSVMYGLTDRFNVGLNTRYRRVRNDALPSNVLSVFGNNLESGESQRQGFTALGPQIRVAPVPSWSNFSIQSSFVFPLGNQLEGSSTQPYIDWSGATWWTQFFNDFPIGDNFSVFTEIDFLIEDLGNDNLNRISTPVTLIFSYNPTNKITLYTIGGYSPYWQENFDYFRQVGLGAKYQFTPNLELELLYSDFSNQFLKDTGGQAATYNVGFRFNLFQ